MATKGKGVTITLIPESGTNIIEGCCITNIGDLEFSAETINRVCHGNGNVTKKIKGVVDLGSLPITIDYKDKTVATALYTALKDDISYVVEITFPTVPVEKLTFSALITGVGESHPKDDVISQNITLELDGEIEPGWT